MNREKVNEYEKTERKIEFNFKLAQTIRVKTRQAFKSQDVEKLNKTFDLLGCSQSFLRKWIFYQLHRNMSEEIYGSMWTIALVTLFQKPIYLMEQIYLNLLIGVI